MATIVTAGARAAMAVRRRKAGGSRAATRAALVMAIIATALGVGGSGPAAAQGDDSAQVHSPLFGLTITWSDQWRAIEVDQEDGKVFIALSGDHGEARLTAAPAFGGDGSLCIDEVERRLDFEPRGVQSRAVR